MKRRKADDSAGFWRDLTRPFFVLAPMANVTDSVFRKLFARYGKPDVTWTEFVSADGLASAGKDKLLIDLEFTSKERPIVAQLFTGHPEAMKKAAVLVRKLKFDGLDINMGCPDRAVERQGGGAAMIKDPKAALAVLAAAREGFGGPVSVKTRLGYNKPDMSWIRMLLEQKLPALTVHLRTRKEMSEVPAHWDAMPEIVKLRDEISPETLLIGNGDIFSLAEAVKKVKETGCDGVMIGRGIFGKPWFFAGLRHVGKTATRRGGKVVPIRDIKYDITGDQKTPRERLKIMVEHATAFEKAFKGTKSFAIMRKHFKAYVSGWDGAKELRAKLMEAESAREVAAVVKSFDRKAGLS